MCIISLPTQVSTETLAQAFSECLQPGMILFMQGEVGAGKTTFIRAMLRALGVKGSIKSPTYALVEPYEVVLPNTQTPTELYHFDFYRCTAFGEWRDAGFVEYFQAPHICLVEWPEKQSDLPAPDWTLQLHVAGSGRTLKLIAHSDTARTWLIAAHDTLHTAAA
jgi:tRNA threonylcarbamoyladenosine biosynthesis protein TsaE